MLADSMTMDAHPFDWREYPRAALVTGAGKRLGRAMALALAEDGWSLAVHYNTSRGEAEEVVGLAEKHGVKAVALGADLAREEQVEHLIPQAADALGPLGLLVNSASIFEMDRTLTATRESWDRHLEINLRAPFVLSQAFAHALPEDRAGLIVNMLDERVWKPTPYFTSYTVAKSGLWTLTRTLALDLAPRIRVNGIGPGYTLPSAEQSEAQFERESSRMPLGRGANPEEIVRALRFFVEATSITGQMVAMDGGQHLAWRVRAAEDLG
jgi:NAD(P)-dependent dehydrogenase (short-subunit alcohol dehydrogenase family)